MNIGFIGTGNMGKILIDAFIESKAVRPSKITIMNRTKKEPKRFNSSIKKLMLLIQLKKLFTHPKSFLFVLSHWIFIPF